MVRVDSRWMLDCTTRAAMTHSASGSVRAVTVYDESVSGDLTGLGSNPDLGTLGTGINTIIGSITATGNGSDGFDGFAFTIATDATYTVSIFNPDAAFIGFTNFTNQGSGSITGVTALTAGNVTFSYTGTVNTGNFDYQIDITVPSVVPLPATLPLFASALGFVGYMGWRRKRKALNVSA